MLRAAEVEVLLTVNDKDVARGEKNLKQTGERIEKKPIVAKVDADAKGALAGMERVETAAKRIVSQRTMATVDANIERAEKQFMRVYERLDYLRSVETELDVSADIRRAEANLQRVTRQLDGLRSAKATMEVDVDTPPPDEFRRRGDEAGDELGDGLLASLAALPIAGAVVGIGIVAGKALLQGFQDGLSIEASYDRLQALSGISEADAMRLGMAAGEAYANVFGESIEANMDTARLALQFDIIDADTSTRDAQRVVEGLSGIADVLGEDIRPVATAVTTLLQTGMAKSAEEAFDILAAGAREGVNRNEDLLDTFTEYPSVLSRLGLTGQEMLGLVNQGLQAGARNSDIAADALKEFQIRATDASDLSRESFQLLGLDAEEMTAKIALGGENAREGLDIVLDRLRAMEDPVARNAAAVGLFGTQAEDLGEALFAMDLSTAVDELNGVTGAAERMFDTLASNDATKVEQARRNIEVAANGIQAALASAFSEPLGDLADWVSQNRGPLLQFMLDLANGALDFGDSVVEGLAAGTEGVGEFVSGPLADLTKGLAGFVGFFDAEAGKGLDELVEDMRGFDETTQGAATAMREQLGGAIDDARSRLNEWGDPVVAMGFLNDASLRLAESLAQVGYDGDGARLSLEGVDVANIRASESGQILEGQVRNAIAALSDEISAASAAGESQEELAGRYRTATDALAGQLTQMGLTEEQARALIDTVLQTPASKTTQFGSNASGEQGKVQSLADRIVTLPDGSVVINADTSPGRSAVDRFIRDYAGRAFNVYVNAIGGAGSGGRGALQQAQGGLVEFMASGGLRGLTTMPSVAQMVPANTWRVVGDRGDVAEAYVPMDGAPRSWAILMEALRRMPGGPDEGLAGAPAPSGPGPSTMPPIQVIHNGDNYAYDPREQAREQREHLARALDSLPNR